MYYNRGAPEDSGDSDPAGGLVKTRADPVEVPGETLRVPPVGQQDPHAVGLRVDPDGRAGKPGMAERPLRHLGAGGARPPPPLPREPPRLRELRRAIGR